MTGREIKIKLFGESHVPAVARIDKAVTGEERADYWWAIFNDYIKRHPATCLLAEVSGENVGFILGDIRGRELGLPESFGWIEMVGVEPRYRRQGIGRRLVQDLIAVFRFRGIKKVSTAVAHNDTELMGFYQALGFKSAEYITLSAETGVVSPREIEITLVGEEEFPPFR